MIISVINRKGGVAKTVSAVNLAAIYGHNGFKVLLIDVDAQMNASSYLGIYGGKGSTTYELLCEDAEIEDVIHHTGICGMDMIPAGMDLDLTESDYSLYEKEYVLKHKLESVKDKYDYIIIDCPAARNSFTKNALAASDYVILPCEANEFCIEGLGAMYDFANKVKCEINLNLKIAGVFFTKKKRTAAQKAYAETFRKELDCYIYLETEIREAAAVERSQNAHKPLIIVYPKAPVTQDYIALAKELDTIMKKEK